MRPQLCRAGTAKFPYYPRKRIWEGGSAFLAAAPRLQRKSPCRIHNRKDAARQQAARPPGRVFTYQTDTPSENTWSCSTIPGILRATTALTGYCIVSISPAGVASRIAVFKLRSAPLFAACLLRGGRGWGQLDDDLPRLMRAPRSPQSNRPSA